jgi:hypothetical protein
MRLLADWARLGDEHYELLDDEHKEDRMEMATALLNARIKQKMAEQRAESSDKEACFEEKLPQGAHSGAASGTAVTYTMDRFGDFDMYDRTIVINARPKAQTAASMNCGLYQEHPAARGADEA